MDNEEEPVGHPRAPPMTLAEARRRASHMQDVRTNTALNGRMKRHLLDNRKRKTHRSVMRELVNPNRTLKRRNLWRSKNKGNLSAAVGPYPKTWDIEAAQYVPGKKTRYKAHTALTGDDTVNLIDSYLGVTKKKKTSSGGSKKRRRRNV